ncbi:MAG: phage holin family protein [Coriobacteriia bacterium]|nr:phage holin family protein [Coriobacteriia bacterium]
MNKAVGIWLITVVAVVTAFSLVSGVGFMGGGISLPLPGILGSDVLIPTLLFSAVLALINTFIKPILKLITLPITIITLGFFALVLNVFVLYLTKWISNTYLDTGFYINSFFSAFLAAIIISIVTAVLGLVTGVDSDSKKSRKKESRRQTNSRPNDRRGERW